MPVEKQCRRCNKAPAVPTEKYCKTCRKFVIEEAVPRQEPVRTLSRDGTEYIGRGCRDWRIVAEQE
jgi:hypothetical protein